MILLLAGTAEARALSKRLIDTGEDVIASLAGATRQAQPISAKTRIGGFGGDDGFRDWLRKHRPRAVIDATHPFAAQITERSARICAEERVPYLLLHRRGWRAEEGDNWQMIAREEDAAALIPMDATVFLATGRQTLNRFENLVPRRMICRQIDPPEGAFPFPGGEYLVSRPPFSVADEITLFKQLGVSHLIVKNAGGRPSRSKLDAARALSIPVLMIERPAPPDCMKVETLEEAITWLKTL